MAWKYDGHSPTEIAEEPGISPETVRSSLRKARLMLTARLAPNTRFDAELADLLDLEAGLREISPERDQAQLEYGAGKRPGSVGRASTATVLAVTDGQVGRWCGYGWGPC
jgi:hypothetical protein